MIVDNFDLFGAIVGPAETEAPLAVDADAMLTLTVTLQGFEPISRRRPKVLQSCRGIEHIQLPFRNGLETLPHWRAAPVMEQRFRPPTSEPDDHRYNI